jgi:hypothetical protein
MQSSSERWAVKICDFVIYWSKLRDVSKATPELDEIPAQDCVGMTRKG